jgi:DNA-binding NarL/FixJ family response regulator
VSIPIKTIAKLPTKSWGALPARVKVLLVTTLHRPGKPLAEALQADSATEFHFSEVIGITAGMARLREEGFDAILVTHDPGVLDALDFIEGLRGGGTDEPVLVLGTQSEQELAALCFEVGADGYCALGSTTTRGLIWNFARAIERHQLLRENRRLAQAERQRLQYEHREAERLLSQQRALVRDLNRNADSERGSRQCCPGDRRQALDSSAVEAFLNPLPVRLVEHYREMLRTYVIMGTGNLSDEMSRLSELLVGAEVTARETMQLHVQVLEELVRGLGNRSARHVMNRADLLVLEVLVHLSEGYRRRYLERGEASGRRKQHVA